MNTLLEILSEKTAAAFEAAGYDASFGKVSVSNRPDLCEFQCNGAMAGAKQNKKAPLAIASEVAAKLSDCDAFSSVEAVPPGFLNLKIREDFLSSYLMDCDKCEKPGLEPLNKALKIIIDYGGPNVAKPLHVGHLRSAVIGEAVKRLCAYMGHEVIGDIHLGDWGLQMGLIIHELSLRQPELPYFDENFEGEYPQEPPFTLSQLEEIYPAASARSKEDEDYKAAAMNATYRLQHGDRGCRALWQHIMDLSKADLKKNYDHLNVSFELWNGESDVDPLIPALVERLEKTGLLYESEGAKVIDVKEESDTKEMPPCMILKSDGASLYATTDLATLVMRMDETDPDRVIYVVDKRQQMHFDQVFRVAKKTGIVPEKTELKFIGFGTMNGRDGKPYKTRDGGVMRLEYLLSDIKDVMQKKMEENKNSSGKEEDYDIDRTARMVSVAALKYADLSNQATKDYIFDMDRFTSFEGNTGPYILYTMVRIKSILKRWQDEKGGDLSSVRLSDARGSGEKDIQLRLAAFNTMIKGAYEELAPHRICAYIYELADSFNSFYHDTKILSEEDKDVQAGWIALLKYTLRIFEICIDILGFEAPDRM